jgi:hypothetical protein
MKDPEHSGLTALIPAGLGVVFVVLGLLARNDHLRKHVMHAAAALGLLGFLGAVIGFVMGSRAATVKPLALGCQAAMALICAAFVGLCVNSFIQARRARAESNKG